MLTQEHIQGGWTELKGKIQQRWGELSNDELAEFEGELNQLVGLIHRKTGDAKAEITKELCEIDSRFRPLYEQAMESAQEYVNRTTQAATEFADDVGQRFAAGHAEAQQLVQRRPMESVAVAFGAGIVAGVIVGLVVRSR